LATLTEVFYDFPQFLRQMLVFSLKRAWPTFLSHRGLHPGIQQMYVGLLVVGWLAGWLVGWLTFSHEP
jgi:hypothetical protein